MKFEIMKSEDNKFYFNIVTNEGRAILTSSHYDHKSSTLDDIISIIEHFVVNVSEDTLNSLEVEDMIVDRTHEGVVDWMYC